MTTNRILISLTPLLIAGTLLSKSAFCDDAVLKRLTSLRLTVSVTDDSGSLSFRIRNMVELKLRQAGLDVRDNADAHLRLDIFWFDLDPTKKRILGKYGILELSLHEIVFLARDPKVRTTAQTWEGNLRWLHGPPDTFPDRTMQFASELVDEFLNNWLKARK
jgi:hypothetical protein